MHIQSNLNRPIDQISVNVISKSWSGCKNKSWVSFHVNLGSTERPLMGIVSCWANKPNANLLASASTLYPGCRILLQNIVITKSKFVSQNEQQANYVINLNHLEQLKIKWQPKIKPN